MFLICDLISVLEVIFCVAVSKQFKLPILKLIFLNNAKDAEVAAP
jgi:hypothetical protein